MLGNLKEFYMAVFYQKKCQQNDSRAELSSGCKNDTSDNIEKKGSP